MLPSPAASHATSPAQKRGPVLTRYPAAYLADRLGKDFGPDRVFRDADALVPGLPWPDGLDRALADARVLVVLIGPGWLDAPGPDGSGRALDRPDDWVRREIRTALTREIPVVPVLLDDTARPAVSDLPAELASLAGLQALRIRHDRLEADVEWLASVLAKHVPALSPVHTIVPVARRGFGRPVAILAATATVLAIAALLVWMSLPTYTVGSVLVPDDAGRRRSPSSTPPPRRSCTPSTSATIPARSPSLPTVGPPMWRPARQTSCSP